MMWLNKVELERHWIATIFLLSSTLSSAGQEFLTPLKLTGVMLMEFRAVHEPPSPIPGSHDTGANNSGAFGSKFRKQTQEGTVEQQLMWGIRALDVRACCDHDVLTIHHGVVYLRKSFQDVMRQVSEFLNNHPTETIAMRIQENYKAIHCTIDFATLVSNELQQWNKQFLLTHTVPKLSAVRGKFIVLQDYDGPQIGLRWDSSIFNIQDQYTVTDPVSKWRYVQAQLANAGRSEQDNSAIWFINFNSMKPTETHSIAYQANQMNPRLYDYFATQKTLTYGIIFMDYPQQALLERLVNNGNALK